MKKILEILLGILGAVLWITDPANILIFILFPGLIIGAGIVNDASLGYYVAALGIYAGICYGISKLIDRAVDKGSEKFDKWLKKRKK